MEISTQPPRGTSDILPGQSEHWQRLESLAKDHLQRAGYKEIRTPTFEHTELFKRGVGETTDIVSKEMYTFSDKSDRSLTLRPEGTAGCVRAFLNAGLHRQSPPVKLWYQGPMYRYERPQTGRQRQFHQLGIEAFGSQGPLIDVEVIVVAHDFLKALGIEDFEVQLNSLGDQACRPAYRELLREKLRSRLDKLCADCKDRFERNPLRMLDCKVPTCQEQYKDIPSAIEHLCDDCQTHWQKLIELVEAQGIKPVINPRMVRGLDYYTRTAFEFVAKDKRLGTQSSIGGGGRYDKLVEMFGGPATPAVGWAFGVDRLLMLLSDTTASTLPAFVVSSNAEKALGIATDLRRAGITTELDFPGQGQLPRNFSKQMQQANKQQAAFVVILGDDELAKGEATIKDMKDGSQKVVSQSELASVLGIELQRK